MTKSQTVVEHRFGFPVRVVDVPMKTIGRHLVADIDARRFADSVAAALATYPSRLHGIHIRFARKRLNLTMQAFGEWLGVTHVAVSKWESAGDAPPKMGIPAEVLIRLRLLSTVPDELCPVPHLVSSDALWLKQVLVGVRQFEEAETATMLELPGTAVRQGLRPLVGVMGAAPSLLTRRRLDVGPEVIGSPSGARHRRQQFPRV